MRLLEKGQAASMPAPPGSSFCGVGGDEVAFCHSDLAALRSMIEEDAALALTWISELAARVDCTTGVRGHRTQYVNNVVWLRGGAVLHVEETP